MQRRTVRLLIGTQVLGGVGMAIGIALAALVVEDLTGAAALAGLGQSAMMVGGALLAIPVVRVTNAHGRRGGLGLAYLAGAAGAAGVVAALWLRCAPLAFAGLFLLGGGITASLQARYAAVDLAIPDARGRHLSVVVWATTVGAVGGPSLAPLADNAIGASRYAGAFLAAAAGFGLAAVVLWRWLRPDPLLLTRRASQAAPATMPGIAAAWRIILHNPHARGGVVALAQGQFVMVAIMAMTPIHITHGTANPATVVGAVLSLHIAGMYGLAPVAGWAADRFGPRAVIFAGAALLATAAALSGTAGHDHTQLAVGLALLGLGWSATLIGGSALLTAAVEPAQRPAVQGLSDLAMGLAGAAAGALAGFVMHALSYPTLTLLAALTTLAVTGLAIVPRCNQPARSAVRRGNRSIDGRELMMAAEALAGRLVRGVIGGLVSGMVFAGVTMWFASTMPDGTAEMPLRMISTVVKGSDAMTAGTTSVGLGWAVHLVLSAAFGVVFALVVPMLRTNGTVALAGTVYGALLYVVNFLILAPLIFTVFQDANQPFELFAHVVFGTLLAFFFYGSGARRDEGFASVGAAAQSAPAR